MLNFQISLRIITPDRFSHIHIHEEAVKKVVNSVEELSLAKRQLSLWLPCEEKELQSGHGGGRFQWCDVQIPDCTGLIILPRF